MYQRNIKPVGWGVSGKVFHKIISLENLFLSWKEFKRSKTNKIDVQQFDFNLEDNIFQLR